MLLKVDYSRDKDGKQTAGIDWVASGNAQKKNGQTAESVLGSGGIKSMGKPYETRSYLRWEDPVLGIGSEGRGNAPDARLSGDLYGYQRRG